MNETPDRKWEIWSKGKMVVGLDPGIYRMDDLGHMMQFDQFGTDDTLAWEYEEKFLRGSTVPDITPIAKLRFKSIFKDVDDYIAEKRREMEKKKPAN